MAAAALPRRRRRRALVERRCLLAPVLIAPAVLWQTFESWRNRKKI